MLLLRPRNIAIIVAATLSICLADPTKSEAGIIRMLLGSSGSSGGSSGSSGSWGSSGSSGGSSGRVFGFHGSSGSSGGSFGSSGGSFGSSGSSGSRGSSGSSGSSGSWGSSGGVGYRPRHAFYGAYGVPVAARHGYMPVAHPAHAQMVPRAHRHLGYPPAPAPIGPARTNRISVPPLQSSWNRPPLPPPGTLGKTFSRPSRPIPWDKHPRVGMIDIHIPASYRRGQTKDVKIKLSMQDVRGFAEPVKGFVDNLGVWHFESKALMPGIPHI